MWTREQILKENSERYKELTKSYDPITGIDAPCAERRICLYIPDFTIPFQYVPESMIKSRLIWGLVKYGTIKDYIVKHLKKEYSDELSVEVSRNIIILRNKHDMPFWAYTIARIKPKEGGELVPFVLTHPQRVLFLEFEKDRLAGIPLRYIIVKARQWGGSTFVQMYMAWIQFCHKKGWGSTIVAQTKTVSARILAMYEKLVENYPPWALDIFDDKPLKLSQYAKGGPNDYAVKDSKNKQIRSIVIQIGSVQEPDNIRGGDVAMIHYSEVGVWKDTPGRRPEDLIRSLTGGMLYRPYTIEVLESTAKGVGNYFHREYQRAKDGLSNRKAFFMPWFHIAHDTISLTEEELIQMADWIIMCKELGELCPDGYPDEGRYYWRLWEMGATLQGIAWYRETRKGVDSHADMASEAPSDDVEAFQNSGYAQFDIYAIDDLRQDTEKGVYGEIVSATGYDTGEKCLEELSFKKVETVSEHTGFLTIWSDVEGMAEMPVSDRYLVIVDVGGRHKKADYSVITVLDRLMLMFGGKEEVVAEWRGHISHDKLAWKAAQIAKYYNNALLVIESNTLETKDKNRDTDGQSLDYILELIAEHYENLYAREKPAEDIGMQKKKTKWGWHTNSVTKPNIINHMTDCIRERAWTERSEGACDEMTTYTKNVVSGVFEAAPGCKDDRVMTRAIGLWLSKLKMPKPKFIETHRHIRRRTEPNTEASI